MFEYVPLDDLNREEELIGNDIKPDEALIKQEAFANLSKEANDVISTILACPAELLDAIYKPLSKSAKKASSKEDLIEPKNGMPKTQRKRLKRFFANKWGQYHFGDVNKAFKEIEAWIRDL